MSLCETPTSACNCPCDCPEHPGALNIPAGLSTLPRQIAGFPEFRRAMLREISTHSPLSSWAAQKDDDLGVMLVEMWAYVCDVLAFYDGLISQEAYLRTASLRPSVRKLVGLLGYLPRPATGSVAHIAALASGRRPVALPAGTAFKSGAFDAEPPQTFELEQAATIHPFVNQWELKRQGSSVLHTNNPSKLTVQPLGEIAVGTWLLVTSPSNPPSLGANVTGVRKYQGDDGVNYTEVQFLYSPPLTAGISIADIGVWQPTLTATLWTRSADPNFNPASGDYSDELTTFILNQQYSQFSIGDYVMVTKEGAYFAGTVTKVQEVEMESSKGNSVTINNTSFPVPSVKVPVTQITVSGDWLSLAFSGSPETDTVKVHFGMKRVAWVVKEPAKTLSPQDALSFTKPTDEPLGTFSPKSFLLQDKNQLGQWLEGGLNNNKNGLDVPHRDGWTEPLYAPVKAFGNVLTVSRGETVKLEVLGNGDASKASQQFQLKKKPLTYFLSPTLENDKGVRSTLEVSVNGILWQEVPSFYGMGPNDEVFIVRQTDEGESIVTFGDGVRGARLPSGSSNITASYRFGAGAATPPAGSINQIAKPVAGLQSITSPVAAAAGADAEQEESLRSNAPSSILILGRAVSMKDMEAVALSVPGVRVAQAEWRWSKEGQRAAAHIWMVGSAGLEPLVSARLRAVTEANTPIEVHLATARPITLHIAVAHDPRYDSALLLQSIQAVLMDAEKGFLLPEQLGVGQHFFRSQLFAAVLGVEGTTSIQAVQWAEGPGTPSPFSSYGKHQNAGMYWDFETHPPVITLSEEIA